MKQNIRYIMLIVSSLIFLTLLVMDVIRVIKYFSDPLSFSLSPILFIVLYLIVLLGHIGIYVMIMDKQELKKDIEDIDEWWTKWDQV